MMNKSLIVVGILLSVQLMSCGEHEHHNYDKKEIVLNNGEKWKANDEMLAYIRESDEIIDAYLNSEEKNVHELADLLKERISKITSSCSMTGEAHEQLHNWLLPYIDLVKQLSESEGEEAEEIVIELKKMFKRFNTYFE